jgi:hypothetical protein
MSWEDYDQIYMCALDQREKTYFSDILEHGAVVSEVSIVDNAVDVPFRLPPEGRTGFDFTREE